VSLFVETESLTKMKYVMILTGRMGTAALPLAKLSQAGHAKENPQNAISAETLK